MRMRMRMRSNPSSQARSEKNSHRNQQHFFDQIAGSPRNATAASWTVIAFDGIKGKRATPLSLRIAPQQQNLLPKRFHFTAAISETEKVTPGWAAAQGHRAR